MPLELAPLVGSRWSVFVGRAVQAPAGEVRLVVANQVLREHGDVAPGGLDVEMAEEGGADVDRQAAVDKLSGEEPTEVVRGEPTVGELRVVGRDLRVEASQHLGGGSLCHYLVALPDAPLEQERLRVTGDPLDAVVAGRERDRRPTGGQAAEDAGQDVEQLGGDGEHALAVGLRWRDDEQGDDLAVGSLILADAQLGELEELLDAHTGVAQRLDDRPLPAGGLLLGGDVDHLAVCLVTQSNVRGPEAWPAAA